MRLNEIEKRILEIKKILSNSDRENFILAMSGETIGYSTKALERENRPLIEERESLEIERQFILDRRNNLFWRTIWSAVIPISVSIGTVVILNLFGLNK